jgi:5-formyltetrahydrofolate cyclo-ligase
MIIRKNNQCTAMHSIATMPHTEKADLRREMRLHLKKVADTIPEKSRLIHDNLMTLDAFQIARQSERLMSYVSAPLEIDTLPLFAGHSMIVPRCGANEIVPVRIMSLEELEPAGSLKIDEPKECIWQDVSRRVLPEQIDVVLVPGLAFDRWGNRLGRGKGYYDRFLRRLPADVLTIGLALEEGVFEHISHDANDCPVKMVITECRKIVRSPHG